MARRRIADENAGSNWRVSLAYAGVVLLWATTPLAIKWSGEGPGFLFGVAGRMAIGAACLWTALAILRRRLPWHRQARLTYLAVALQIFGSMLVVYWSAQFIPSGWISVVFGLTPLLTALMAAAWLGERSLGGGQLLSYAMGLAGLAAMFGTALAFSREAAWGIAGVLLSSFLQSASAVWVKRIGARLSAWYQVAGGLLIALPAYLAVWLLFDGQWPQVLPLASLASILYLGAVATTLGFAGYYYVLTHLPATRVALITLITPVLSLLVGHAANQEPLTPRLVLGTALILAALLVHTWATRAKPAPLKPRRRKRTNRR